MLDRLCGYIIILKPPMVEQNKNYLLPQLLVHCLSVFPWSPNAMANILALCV